jgi:DUF1680 family protein
MVAARAVPFTAVSFDDGFWDARQEAIRSTTIPFLHQQYEKAGIFDALDVHAPPGPLPIAYEVTPIGTKPATPVMYWDSDIGKWIEAAAYTLAVRRDARLEEQIDGIVTRIAAAQQPDGYFNTYFQRRAPEAKWSNLRDWHELYCAGHLMEGAVAYAAATGKRALLDVMCRYADLIARLFGRGEGQRHGYCGHEEIELALVKLARFTGEKRYMDLARYFIDERGAKPHYFDAEARARGSDPASWYHRIYEYNQSHVPVREQDKVVGHAVRAMYLYSAMADLAAEDDDEPLRAACVRLWHDLTRKRLYVTGGLGPSWTNEGFTGDYDLPNETAYAETCAAVGLVYWAHRMLLMTGESEYADVMERALYNGALSGISLHGDRFFYENRLASRGGTERWIWHRCPCCPANIARLVASVGEYVASVADDEVSVHLYAQNTARVALQAASVTMRQTTRFPWDGAVAIAIGTDRPASFALRLRIPDWSPSFTVTVNGETVEHTLDRGYLRLNRTWSDGDQVSLSLAMPAARLYARPDLVFDLGRVALRRGPFIYCVEEEESGGDVERLVIDSAASIGDRFDADLLGGVSTLDVTAWTVGAPERGDDLYRDAPPVQRRINARAIPYPYWAHRSAGSMAVWLRASPVI